MKLFFIVIVSFFVFFTGFFRPFHNPDVVPYMAAAYQSSGVVNVDDIRGKIYEMLKRDVSEKKLKQLEAAIGKPDDSGTFSFDPRIIPMYSVKVGYIFLIRLTSGMFGCDYDKSIIILSSAFAGLSVLILGLLLVRENIEVYILPFMIFCLGYLDLASLATPDAIACFIGLACVYFIERPTLLVALSLSLIFFRPDCIIFTLLFLWMGIRYFRANKFIFAFAVLSSFFAYFLITRYSGNMGWVILFKENFMYAETFSSGAMSFHAVLKIYLIELYNIVSKGEIVLYVLAGYFFVVGKVYREVKSSDFLYFVLPSIYLLVHLLYFPHYEHRYFAFADTLVFMWLIQYSSSVGSKNHKRITG